MFLYTNLKQKLHQLDLLIINHRKDIFKYSLLIYLLLISFYTVLRGINFESNFLIMFPRLFLLAPFILIILYYRYNFSNIDKLFFVYLIFGLIQLIIWKYFYEVSIKNIIQEFTYYYLDIVLFFVIRSGLKNKIITASQIVNLFIFIALIHGLFTIYEFVQINFIDDVKTLKKISFYDNFFLFKAMKEYNPHNYLAGVVKDGLQRPRGLSIMPHANATIFLVAFVLLLPRENIDKVKKYFTFILLTFFGISIVIAQSRITYIGAAFILLAAIIITGKNIIRHANFKYLFSLSILITTTLILLIFTSESIRDKLAYSISYMLVYFNPENDQYVSILSTFKEAFILLTNSLSNISLIDLIIGTGTVTQLKTFMSSDFPFISLPFQFGFIQFLLYSLAHLTFLFHAIKKLRINQSNHVLISCFLGVLAFLFTILHYAMMYKVGLYSWYFTLVAVLITQLEIFNQDKPSTMIK